MYNRADLSRTVTLVAALFPAAVATGAVARGFRAADAQGKDGPTDRALRYMCPVIAERSGAGHPIRVFHARRFGEENMPVITPSPSTA